MSKPRWFKSAKNVLLTGAGFTRGFGGYLGSEMWAVIFRQPEIQRHPKLRKRMLDELNYEMVYETVLESGEHDETDKNAFIAALRNGYQQLHDIVCRQDNEHIESSSNACQFLLTRFAGQENQERGFIFTLNQDLFVEKYYTCGDPRLIVPGLTAPSWFNGQLRSELTPDSRAELPDAIYVESLNQRFWDKGADRLAYIKLHGSFGWRTAAGDDVMVVGHSKSKVIQQQPLLRWYLSIFEEVLREPNCNLVAIGYGFGDHHVNDVIANAMRDCGLKLYLISPEDPIERRTHFMPPLGRSTTASRGREIWGGLAGYYRASATDLYRRGTRDLPPEGRALFESLGWS